MNVNDSDSDGEFQHVEKSVGLEEKSIEKSDKSTIQTQVVQVEKPQVDTQTQKLIEELMKISENLMNKRIIQQEELKVLMDKRIKEQREELKVSMDKWLKQQEKLKVEKLIEKLLNNDTIKELLVKEVNKRIDVEKLPGFTNPKFVSETTFYIKQLETYVNNRVKNLAANIIRLKPYMTEESLIEEINKRLKAGYLDEIPTDTHTETPQVNTQVEQVEKPGSGSRH